MIGKFLLEISSLYCLTTFMTLSPHYLVTFIILSLFINEETLFFPGYHRYGLRFGLFSFRSGYGRCFTGRAYLVRNIFHCFGNMPDMADGGSYSLFYGNGSMGTQASLTFLGRGPVTGGGGRNGRSVDCIAGSTVWKCMVCVGGFCPLSSV